MVRKDLVNKKVVRAIALGLSAVMLTTPMTAMASAETAETTPVTNDGEGSTTATEEVTVEDVKEALNDAVEEEVEAAIGAVITVGQGVISNEALGIINEVQAAQKVAEAEVELKEGEKAVADALEGFDDDLDDVNEDSQEAVDASGDAADAAQDAADALDVADDATTSADAKAQQNIAEEAKDAAQAAADTAAEEAQNAKDAYVLAEAKYNAAVKEAAEAQALVDAALTDASINAEEAAKKAEAAEAKVAQLKKDLDAARGNAEKYFTEKQEELASAQVGLEEAKEALDKEVADEEEAREELLAATGAVVETGAFLAAAEAYEALSEVAVEGIEAAIVVMEEAKELAEEALAKAEEALANAEGNEAEAQAAYDAAVVAYEAADATLAQANEDLAVAKAEKDSTDALANSEYGRKLTALEKELIEAKNAGDTETVEAKTQEIIATVLKYDQDSAEAKYDSVEVENADSKIYVAKDSEGKETYYQYVANADGSISFFECNKNESASIVTGKEIVSNKEEADAKVAGLEAWQYKITELEGGSYNIEYLDVQEDGVAEYTDKAEAEAAANTVEDGVEKIFYDETEVDTATFVAVEGTPDKNVRKTYIEAYEAAQWALAGLGIDTSEVPENPVEPTAPTREEYSSYLKYLGALAEYGIEYGKYEAYVAYNTALADYNKCTAEEERMDTLEDYLNNDYTLTIDGTTAVLSDANGLYYVNAEGQKVYDLTDCTVNVEKITEKYRVVKYTKTVTPSYDFVDNRSDADYSNITNQVNAANDKFTAATDDVTKKAATKNAAEADEKAKAAVLADAEAELEKTQKVNDALEELYDYYYVGEIVDFEIPEWAVQIVNGLGIADTTKIISTLVKLGVLEELGIEASADDMYIEISDDGQVTIEIPGTSKYAQHMLALKVAKVAAEQNLEKARETVAEKKTDHEEALEALRVETEEYNEAIGELAEAAVNVGMAEVKVAGATVNVATAQAALDALKVADAYVAKLQEEVKEASDAADLARKKVEALKESSAVSEKVLEEAVKALNDAEDRLAAAEAAAEAAQEDANAAKAAYDEIAKIVEELAAKEAAARAEADDDDDDDYTPDREVITLPTGDVVVLGEEVVSLTVAPAVVAIEDEETPLAAEIDDADANDGDDEVIVAEAEDTEQEIVAIEDEETPLAPGMEEKAKMSWWWLLIVALFGTTGYAMYRKYHKKEDTQEA